MMVMTAKLNKGKILTYLLIFAAIAALLVIMCTNAGTTTNSGAVETRGVESNEDRIAFLKDFGWEVHETPVEMQEVLVPSEPSVVFERYNALQKSQGYDLEPYAGKEVKRFVYEITNYPDAADSYYATMFVYKNEVIGGDVSASSRDGVMHGFAAPS